MTLSNLDALSSDLGGKLLLRLLDYYLSPFLIFYESICSTWELVTDCSKFSFYSGIIELIVFWCLWMNWLNKSLLDFIKPEWTSFNWFVNLPLEGWGLLTVFCLCKSSNNSKVLSATFLFRFYVELRRVVASLITPPLFDKFSVVILKFIAYYLTPPTFSTEG